jgi:hypothetical protein
MLRLFETGDREEDRIVANLRLLALRSGRKIQRLGMQVRFEACGGHVAMSLDGVGEGFKEAKSHTHLSLRP